MRWIFAVALFGHVLSASAATVAVIDSGLDYKHDMIVPNLWTNAKEVEDRRDNDGNGYQDDIHGWNFAEQNSELIDYKYLGTFSPDCKTYFDVQGKILMKQATEGEIRWMKEKQADPVFAQEMGKFGNFVHGTHVSGVAIRNSKNTVMGIKLLPTEVKPFFKGLVTEKSSTADRWQILEMGFDALAKQQSKLLSDIARFVAYHKSEVANGSFGTGIKQAKMIGDLAFTLLFFRKPDEMESQRAAKLFIDTLLKNGKDFVGSAPHTLFVFASGNDGVSNDDNGTFPANIDAHNVISVGATYKNEFLASFSNFGVKTVDVAAPGMLIDSAIPGNEYLKVSGTSQAAPYVANLAAKVKDANPKLTPAEVKKILIGTVDKKAFLADKVASGGIVNTERAVVAAEMTQSLSVSEAIERSLVQVKDAPTLKSLVTPMNVSPMELSPLFR